MPHPDRLISRWSIRQALYALVLCAICPALAVIVYHGVLDYRRAQQDIKAQTSFLVKNLAAQQQLLTENTRVLLHTLSLLPEVRSADVQAMHELFRNLLTVHTDYANISFVNMEGYLVSSSHQFTPPVIAYDRKYFTDAVRTGRFSAGEYVVGRVVTEPITHFSLPAYDAGGAMSGVLVATVKLGQYERLFSEVVLPRAWRFALLDHKGVRLMRLPLDDAIPVGREASPGVRKNLDSFAEDEGTFTTLGPDGIDVTYAFARLRLTPDAAPYMTVVIGFPAPSFLSVFRTSALPNMLTMLGALALALLIARSLGTAAIGSGLTLLNRATSRLAAGELSHRVGSIPACREIRELGHSFDSMAEALLGESAVRIQAEAELTRAKSYIANILDSMPSAVIGLDGAGVVTHWNRAAQAQTGLSPASALGRPMEEAFPRLAPHGERIRAALGKRRPLSVERDPFEKDAERAYQDIMVYPLSGDAAGAAVVRVDDVTQRVRIEEMMVQSEKMMSLGGLAAGMAHEINNPLGAIMQSAQVVQTRFDPASAANRAAAGESGCPMEGIRAYAEKRSILSFLDGIREAGHRAARIVANMLDFSRKSQEQRLPADMNALLERAVELALSDYDLKKKYDFRAISIIRDYAQDLPEIPCSRTEIEQVVLNLLKNAAQAMGGEKGQADVKPVITLHTALDGQFVRIEVGDNGPGMDESVRKRIFEPFFTTKPVGEGTGLGLSVSYFIVVTNHGGRFEVESAPGKGTRFILRLPVAGGRIDPVPPPAL